ncbi:sigma-70 family RNA polymerase sigma factor [Streptomyces sp. TRM 70351]|uniref:RNA polymerase sigma factor n=1 Tax=Streptomyces sp. TRM 70351 TaxID=3116552 RepID=UPI002E7AE4C7|nr:sigma-70 family RNA polymerase sigma factor [Streptomyces sp. TRM 70351]MEE1929115.1 sigma-70 family RNA polymerase sigma factor [Streptomyces sp. TRM 70351]
MDVSDHPPHTPPTAPPAGTASGADGAFGAPPAPAGPGLPERLRRLLAAECAAEAHAAPGTEAEDLEQAVLLRWLEHHRTHGPPARPGAWLRAAVRAEARPGRRRARREVAYASAYADCGSEAGDAPPGAADEGGGPAGPVEHSAELRFLAQERGRLLRSRIPALPGRCPRVLTALLADEDATYREIAGELGISQGSLGPLRSRCLGCLRRMLLAEVGNPDHVGRVR